MPSDEPREPRRRRAVRPAGTVGGDEANLRSSFPAAGNDEPPPPAPQAGEPTAPGVPGSARRAPDDEDVGWGARVDDSNDDRLTRERPPHW